MEQQKRRGRPKKSEVKSEQVIDLSGQNHGEILAAIIEDVKSINTKMDRGVLLVATGHPYYYHLAANLANSIKYQNPDIKIALINDGVGIEQLTPERLSLFDIKIPTPDYCNNGDPYFVKLCLDRLTPFKKSLYLDVDMICTSGSKTVDGLFSELDGIQLAIANRGRITNSEMFSQWAKLDDIKNTYNVDGIYDLSSEVMYFEACDALFEKARVIYDERKMEIEKFGRGYPDEFFLSIAIELCNIKPHKAGWMPSYWMNHYFLKPKPFSVVQDNFYFYSIGGARQNDFQRKQYNLLNEHYHYRMGGSSRNIYKINFDKRKVTKERNTK